MHSKPAAFFVTRLPFFFFFFPPVPLPLSLVKPVGRRHHRSRNLPLSPFSFPFDITKREEGSGNGGEPVPEGRRFNWLPLMAVTSNSRGHWRRRQRKQKKIPIWSPRKSNPHSISGKIHPHLISEKILAKPPRKKKIAFFFPSLCFMDLFIWAS